MVNSFPIKNAKHGIWEKNKMDFMWHKMQARFKPASHMSTTAHCICSIPGTRPLSICVCSRVRLCVSYLDFQ